MTENDFLRRILLHSVRFSPSYLMMLFSYKDFILFKTTGKLLCTSGEEKGEGMKMILKEK